MEDKTLIKYRLKVLKEMRAGQKSDPYYGVQIKGSDTKNINLDASAVNALIRHYQRKLK